MNVKELTALGTQVEAMFNDGKTDEQIAEKLKQNVITISSIRKMLGLYKKYGYFDPTTKYKTLSKDNTKGHFYLYLQIRQDLMEKMKLDIRKRYKYILAVEKGALTVNIEEDVE